MVKESIGRALRQVSKKQAKKNQIWSGVKKRRLIYLEDKYGYLICEYCGGSGIIGGDLLTTLEAHHIDRNRSNNTDDNCYILHSKCHRIIDDKNIAVKQEDFRYCSVVVGGKY